MILERIVKKGMKKTDLGDRFLYHFSRDIVAEIKDTTDATAIAAKIKVMFQRDSDIWGSTPKFNLPLDLQRFIGDFGNPSFERIHHFMKRFGYTSFRNDLFTLLKANCDPCINMIANVNDQRNKIAHGDFAISSNPNDLADMIRLVEEFCCAVDGIVAVWFSSKKCAIRP